MTHHSSRTSCYVFNYELLMALGVYLVDEGTGDQGAAGTSPEASQGASSPEKDPTPPAPQGDLPF